MPVALVLPPFPDSWISMMYQTGVTIVAVTGLVTALRNWWDTRKLRQHVEDTAVAATYLDRANSANPATENVPDEVIEKVKKIANGHGAPPNEAK